jgi:hypothetical protein
MRTSALVAACLSACVASGCAKVSEPPASQPDAGAFAPSPPSSAPSAQAFLGGFEGEVSLELKSIVPTQAGTTSAKLLVKEGRVRIDMPENASPFGKAYALYDSARKKIDMVMDTRREIIDIDLDRSGQYLKIFSDPPLADGGIPHKTPGRVVKTGKTDTVAGQACELWDIVRDHRILTICVEEGDWFAVPASAAPEQPWVGEVFDGKHFPLRFVVYGPDGTHEQGRLEATKLARKDIPAASMVAPDGYKVTDYEEVVAAMQRMRAMGGGMSGLPAGIPGAPPVPPPVPPASQPPHP